MDDSAPEIVFTETGCNFCDAAEIAYNEVVKHRYTIGNLNLKVDKSKKYDVLIGLSGGVDSSYLLHLAVGFGLRPLCFTMDNGYNDPVADENIMKLVEGLKVPLYRYVIDLSKFKLLQTAFLKAGVKNVEIPTDHILMAVSYELASRYGIKTILSGGNVATESIMPVSWGHNARDLVHIKDIYRKVFGKGLNGLPLCSIWKWNYYRWVQKIKIVYLLDYFFYNRDSAIEVLEQKYGYKNPGAKHEENVWTKWFQNFYLFEKWGIDKRKAHLSSMIVSGQITRNEALHRLSELPMYPELGIEQKVMAYPKHEHSDYKMDKWYDRIAALVRKV
jgi:hypothetical protein